MTSYFPTRLQNVSESSAGVLTDFGNLAIGALVVDGFAGFRFSITEKGVLYTASSFELRRTLLGDATGTATFYVVNDRNCPESSSTALPSNRRLAEIGSYIGTVEVTPHVVDLRVNETLGGATALKTVLSFGADQNTLGLVIGWTGDGDVSINLADAFSLTYQDAFTGLEGPWKAQGRADRCPKCGVPSTRDKWIRDRFSDRMVCPRCYDPLSFEDVDRKRLVGREREGLGEG